jgi:hypothetical protein
MQARMDTHIVLVMLLVSVAAPGTVQAQGSCSTAPPAVLNGRWPTTCTGATNGTVCTAVCNPRYAGDGLLLDLLRCTRTRC